MAAQAIGVVEGGMAVPATMATRAFTAAQDIEAVPWLADRLVADSAVASRQEALHGVAFTAAVVSTAGVASTAADTGRLHP